MSEKPLTPWVVCEKSGAGACEINVIISFPVITI